MVAILNSENTPSSGWIPPSLEGHQKDLGDLKISPAELQKAKEKLKAHSGPVTAAYNTNVVNGLLMEKLLSKKLGLQLTLSSSDWKTYIAAVRGDTPNIYRYQRGASFMDPIWHLSSFVSDDPNNPTGWKNAKYDELVEKIAGTPSGSARRKLIAKAERILVQEEAIVIPIYYVMASHLVSPRVQGFKMNPLNGIAFNELSLKTLEK
jgi:ABC-type oligopeptide transport system substrate-binding subunit